MAGSEAATGTLAEAVLTACRGAGLTVATAESCTGGLVAAALTDIAGSSAVFDRGFVTYSDTAKIEMLGVDPALIAEHGAVSDPVARAMVAGAIARSGAALAVAITGIAGPGGGTPTKPEGLVHFACALRDGPVVSGPVRYGAVGRHQVRAASVRHALELLATTARG